MPVPPERPLHPGSAVPSDERRTTIHKTKIEYAIRDLDASRVARNPRPPFEAETRRESPVPVAPQRTVPPIASAQSYPPSAAPRPVNTYDPLAARPAPHDPHGALPPPAPLPFGEPAPLPMLGTKAQQRLGPLAPATVGDPHDDRARRVRRTETVDMRALLAAAQEMPVAPSAAHDEPMRALEERPRAPHRARRAEILMPQVEAPERSASVAPRGQAPSASSARSVGSSPMQAARIPPTRALEMVTEPEDEIARPPRKGLRTVGLLALCLVALGLAGASFAMKTPALTEASVAPTARRAPLAPPPTEATPPVRAAAEPTPRAPAAPERKSAAPDVQPIVTALPASDSPGSRDTPAAQPAAAPASDKRGEERRGNPTPQSAAMLYINGNHKDALTEYRLLARMHPEQTVYAELARILRGKLYRSCIRTQPHRRDECHQL